MSRLNGLHSAALFRQASEYGDILSAMIEEATEIAPPQSMGELDSCSLIAADAATLREWAQRLEADARLNEYVPVTAFLAGFRVSRTLEVMHASPGVSTALILVGVEGPMVRHLVRLFTHFLDLLSAPQGMKA